jgi:hypothetical protein
VNEIKPRGAHGWTFQGVFILQGIFVIAMMGLDIIFTDGIGILSDVGLLTAALVCALMVRGADWQAAVWAPVLTWVLALLTVGQLATPTGGRLLAREVLHLGYGLAYHSRWIIAASVLAALIAGIRRARNS